MVEPRDRGSRDINIEFSCVSRDNGEHSFASTTDDDALYIDRIGSCVSAWKRRFHSFGELINTSFNDASSRSSLLLIRLLFHFIAQSLRVLVSFVPLSERLYDYCFFVGVHGCRTALTAAAEEVETVSTNLFGSRSVKTHGKTGIACIIEQTITPCKVAARYREF